MTPLRTSLRLAAGVLAFCLCSGVEAGVLLPRNRQQMDLAIFSLNKMTFEILIDNGVARLRVWQIFGNHGAAIQEGTYHFALPGRASISDFAVWDGVARIPGVSLNRSAAADASRR
jgi:Ca-activated chloride channel homolog